MRRGCRLFPTLGALVVLLLVSIAMPTTAQTGDGSREVRAAHILLSPDHDPSGAMSLDPADPAWETAEAAADAVATELRAITEPVTRAERFAELARELSDDTSSGAQGGDLGAFPRDMMVPEFGDAIFDVVDPQAGDILGPVRTQFGWHVILYQGEAGADGSPPPPDPTGTPAPTPGLTLLDPGAEPRSVLRYAPAAASTATITMTAVNDQTVTIEGIDPIRTTSAMTMVWDAATDDVASDGTTRSDLILRSVTIDGLEGLPAASAEALRTQLAGMVGLSGWTVSDATGTVLDTGVDLPASVDPQLGQVFRQSIESFARAPAAFVTDPVGVGARWTVVAVTPPTDLTTAGTSVLDVTITAIDGTSVTTHTSSTSTVDQGIVAYPGMPADATVRIEGGSGIAEATTTMDLTALRMTSTARSTSTIDMLVETSGQTVPMTVETTMEMTITAE